MSKTHEIKVTKRELQRKGASRRLRHAGVIPAIVYGGNAEPVAISLDHNEIWLAQQNEWFYASIPLHFVNEDTSPAGKAADVVVTHELKEVTITCLPKDLPESIEVDLGELKAGDVVYLSDIKLPKGVEIPALALGKDHDDAIVTAKAGKADAADEEAAAAE